MGPCGKHYNEILFKNGNILYQEDVYGNSFLKIMAILIRMKCVNTLNHFCVYQGDSESDHWEDAVKLISLNH